MIKTCRPHTVSQTLRLIQRNCSLSPSRLHFPTHPQQAQLSCCRSKDTYYLRFLNYHYFRRHLQHHQHQHHHHRHRRKAINVIIVVVILIIVIVISYYRHYHHHHRINIQIKATGERKEEKSLQRLRMEYPERLHDALPGSSRMPSTLVLCS